MKISLKKCKFKYLVFCPKLGDGGAEKVLVNYANFLAEDDKEVFLISLQDGPYRKQINDKVRVKIISTKLRFSIIKLIKFCYQNQISTIITGMPGPNLIAIIVGYFMRLKVIISMHNDYTERQAINKSALGYITPQINWFTCRFADKIIAVSNGVAEPIKKHQVLSEKTFVIHNAIELNRIPDINLRREYIVAVGRLTHQKGFDQLIHAYSKISKRNRLPLKIVGNGPELRTLTELIRKLNLQDQIEILPFQQDVVSVYEKARLLVVSSRWEGFGNVIIEALRCGVPVVSYDIKSGPSEILDGNPFGILVAAGDIEAMARKVDEFSNLTFEAEKIVKTVDRFEKNAIKKRFLEAIMVGQL